MLKGILGSAALLCASAVLAAGIDSRDPRVVPAGNYVIDTSHASVAATVDHTGFSSTVVRFDNISGSFSYDPAASEKSSIDVSIDAAGLYSGWAQRDEHLKGSQFFNVAAFPTITFKSAKLTRTGDHTANVEGDITLLGSTKPVVLAVTFNGYGKGLDGAARTGFSATTKIKRSDFGMKTFIPIVGDEVDIRIDAEFSKK